MLLAIPPAFTTHLHTQPGPIRVAFQYDLAQLMPEAGQAKLLRTEPGESAARCTFPYDP